MWPLRLYGAARLLSLHDEDAMNKITEHIPGFVDVDEEDVAWWWVVGYLDNLDGITLPEWQGGEDGETEED
jgi:hypothetical protein